MCITSVERIKEYINLPPQADDGADDSESSRDHCLPPPADEDDEDDAGKGKAVSKYSMSISTKKNKIKAKGSIVFRNVIARYGPNLPPALKGLNIAIKPGQRVGICGRTGSGKSTLLAVLWRLIEYDTEEGEVLVDGKEITERSLASLRSSMSIIPQGESWFFDGRCLFWPGFSAFKWGTKRVAGR
jgi:ABC-type multidrug transport system fused ATPase/permease subunit